MPTLPPTRPDPWAPEPAPQPRIHFSPHELLHLFGAVILLTLAFAFVLPGFFGEEDATLMERLDVPPYIYLASLLAVGSGFVLHELAHKLLAQHYGHWAEFRAQFTGLALSVAVALGLGFLFAAPGAVHIWGRVTPKENGLISLMGPLTNMVIALIALPFMFTPNTETLGYKVALTVALVNSVLAVFNLLPFGPLDGKKIWRWSKLVYLLSMVAGVALVFFVYVRL